MTAYTVTRAQAVEFLTCQFERFDCDRNSSNPIIRTLARDALPILETVIQWLDTLEGAPPVAQITACLGDVEIIDTRGAGDDEYTLTIYPPVFFRILK